MRTRRFHSLPFVLLPALTALGACGDDDDDSVPVPILDPEPATAPDEVADGLDLDGRTTLGCLGRNEPDPPDGANLLLLGWVRTLADPANDGETQPPAEAEAFDETGASVGLAFSDTGNGRITITVPIRETGFLGAVEVRSDGFVDQRFASSRPVTGTAAAGWTWLVTQADLDGIATDAAVELEAGTGVLVGSVHDCDVFGVANAVIRAGGSTEGVLFFDGFVLAPERTFTADSGRFAIPNIAPGVVTVEAFGRTRDGGPLELLSLAEVEVSADMVTAVDLQPRMGALR
jgi:hypothetical protein